MLPLYIIAIVPIFMLAGAVTGYKISKKKIAFPIRFVDASCKEKILEEKGIEINEETKCEICGERVTLENLGAIKPSPSRIIFICSKPECMDSSIIISP